MLDSVRVSILFAALWPAATWAQGVPECRISEKPAPRVKPSACGASTVLCPVQACGGVSGITCVVGFGLYRGTGNASSRAFLCPPRKKVFSLAGQWVRTDDYLGRILEARLLSMSNKNSIALDDQLVGAFSQMVQKAADTTVPFWIIIRNESDNDVELKFYVLSSQSPLSGVYDDGDRTLWEHGDAIFNALRQYKMTQGQLEEHSYKVGRGQTVLRGLVPSMLNDTDKEGFYPIGLFSQQAVDHYQLDARDILALGLVHGRSR